MLFDYGSFGLFFDKNWLGPLGVNLNRWRGSGEQGFGRYLLVSGGEVGVNDKTHAVNMCQHQS